MPEEDLVAICDHCLETVANSDGVLEVDTAAADQALRAWTGAAGADPDAIFPASRQVPWRTRHHACGTPLPFSYSIAVERVRSWPALLEWTVHLAGKPWAAATDWHDLLDRALHPRRAAVSGILPRRPRDLAGGPVGDRPTHP